MTSPLVSTGPQWLVAPAKLTVSLRVLGRRDDGYHELESEMVSLDLHDRLLVDPAGSGIRVESGPAARAQGLSVGEDNIVSRALAAAGVRAGVHLLKQVPVGGGLGGGSSDAAAILRWAGVEDLGVAATLGADVPFCLAGGRAIVGGLGERVRPLDFEPRSFVLLVPPFSVDTAAVYRVWDELAARNDRRDQHEGRPHAGGDRRQPSGPDGSAGPDRAVRAASNDLEEAARVVEPRLEAWGAALGDATGAAPVLAGSGSTWWVEGDLAGLGLGDRQTLAVGRDEGRLIPVRTVPAGWTGPSLAREGAPRVADRG